MNYSLDELLAKLLDPTAPDREALIAWVDQAAQVVGEEMSRNGYPVDLEYLQREARRLEREAHRARCLINQTLSDLLRRQIDIRPGSPADVARVLFGENGLGLESTIKTPGGKPSTSDFALAGLADKYPVVRTILDWRSLDKLRSVFFQGYQAHVSPDGRIHPRWLMSHAPTGRTASDAPNMQNIPGHTEWTFGDKTVACNMRDAFVAPPGWYWLTADYSQVEFRIIVGEAQDERMLSAYRQGVDVHALTAAVMFRVPIEAVTKEQRAKGKVCNFALCYGQSAFSLAQRQR